MDANLETEKLVKKPVHPSQLSPNQTSNHNVRHFLLNCSSTTTPVLSILLQPFKWLQMLSSQLNASFVLGIFLVHGLSQGFSGSYFKVVSDYYWKDVQKVQPSVVQLFLGLYYIPWVIKPVWGLLTDLFPVGGYRRRPYFILAGALGTVSATVVALGGSMAVVVALGSLIGVTAAMAIASVTIDACIARNSIEIRSLAPDLQSLCGFCSSVGSLVGYSSSGFFVHHLGAQVNFLFPSLKKNSTSNSSPMRDKILVDGNYNVNRIHNIISQHHILTHYVAVIFFYFLTLYRFLLSSI